MDAFFSMQVSGLSFPQHSRESLAEQLLAEATARLAPALSAAAAATALVLLLAGGALLWGLSRRAQPAGGAAGGAVAGFKYGLLSGCCAPTAPAICGVNAVCAYACCCTQFAAHEVVVDVKPDDACMDLVSLCLQGMPCCGCCLRCAFVVRRRDASRALVGLPAMDPAACCVEVCLCAPCAVAQELAEVRDRRARERASGAAKAAAQPPPEAASASVHASRRGAEDLDEAAADAGANGGAAGSAEAAETAHKGGAHKRTGGLARSKAT